MKYFKICGIRLGEVTRKGLIAANLIRVVVESMVSRRIEINMGGFSIKKLLLTTLIFLITTSSLGCAVPSKDDSDQYIYSGESGNWFAEWRINNDMRIVRTGSVRANGVFSIRYGGDIEEELNLTNKKLSWECVETYPEEIEVSGYTLHSSKHSILFSDGLSKNEFKIPNAYAVIDILKNPKGIVKSVISINDDVTETFELSRKNDSSFDYEIVSYYYENKEIFETTVRDYYQNKDFYQKLLGLGDSSTDYDNLTLPKSINYVPDAETKRMGYPKFLTSDLSVYGE